MTRLHTAEAPRLPPDSFTIPGHEDENTTTRNGLLGRRVSQCLW